MANVSPVAFPILCCLFVVIGRVRTEKFFQHRGDHRDQFDDQRTATMAVHNKIEAEQQLEKYGYLHCTIRQRHKRSLFSDLFSEGGTHGRHPGDARVPPCTSREVRKAIKQYQKKYNLPETGILDRQTKQLMSTSRCGNSDKSDSVLNPSEDSERTSSSAKLQEFMQNNNDINNKNKQPAVIGDHFKSRPWKRSATNSNLLNVISGSNSAKPSSSLERRKRYLHDYVERLKSEDPMLYNENSDSNNKIIKIHKRSVNVAAEEHIEKSDPSKIRNGQKFEKQVIKWRLLESGYSVRIPVEDQRSTIDLAFRMWSEVIPLKFVEETSGDIASVDIEVAFGTGKHQNCKRAFDGHGGEIAHSFSTGNMHFDDDEYFKTMQSFSEDGIYLLRVAVHEIGHVLGLTHTDKKYSIMYAIYEKEHSYPVFELGWEDRKDVQQVYGVCKGKFNTVFDWVRRNDAGKFVFNTYFFRDNHYWMYENHANRTRYGDPLFITNEWRGVPPEPDGYAQVLYINDNDVVDEAYFFKGTEVFKYDNANDQLFDGWPRLIKDVFKGETADDVVPDNLDTVFFDIRDKNMYFFKDDMVYVYDPKGPEESRGCCLRKRNIREEFPAIEGSIPLPDNLDAVYFSHTNETMYFIKDEDVWRNVGFNIRQKHVKNAVSYLGKWFDYWFDICDVNAHSTHVFDFQKT